MEEKELIEKLAALEHEQFANWTKYMLTRCGSQDFEQVKEDVLRWRKQCDTPYSQLTEKEKESDREWARKVLEIIKS